MYNLLTIHVLCCLEFSFILVGGGGDDGVTGSSGGGDKGGDSVVLTCPKCNAPFTHIETFEGNFSTVGTNSLSVALRKYDRLFLTY